MLKTFSRALAALALLFAPTAHAQKTEDADPALWVVKDADTTIYLFGTVHVLKPGLSWFDEGVKAAFDKSDELVLEMIDPDPATMQALVAKLAVAQGTKLTDKLPADRREAYLKMMADIGIPAAAFDPLEPWFAALTLSVAPLTKLGYDPEQGAEKVLSAAAKAANKPVAGLETVEQQLGFLDGLSEEAQLKFLISTIDDYPKLGAEIGEMVTRWSKGDAEGLGKTMNEAMVETPELSKVLLADRNARWAEWIAARMDKPGTVFIAVGAGHLAGGDSVQAQLAARKLKVKRVKY